MTNVICAALDCKYNSEEHLCTAQEIKLRDDYVNTVYQGRQHFNTCKNYEIGYEQKMLEEKFNELFKKMEEMD